MTERGSAEPRLNPGARLDAVTLVEDVNQMVQVIGTSLDPSMVESLLGDLRRSLKLPLPDKHLVRLALLTDCLRIIKETMAADGEISDDEIDASVPLLALISTELARSMDRYQELAVSDTGSDSARAFVAAYASDTEPAGYLHTASEWHGLELCRQTALASDPEALAVYQQMALRLFDEIARINGLTNEEHQARSALQERLALRAAIDVDHEHGPGPGPDQRAAAFLAADLGLFSSVAHAHMRNQRDPLDVEDVHAEARDAFSSVVDRATAKITHDHGRMLLILGESGSGKTHLLRALRGTLHSRRLGYAAYVQLHSRNEDYARYMAVSLVDALDRSYDQPDDERSGLLLLSTSLTDLLSEAAADEVGRLHDGDGANLANATDLTDTADLADLVNDLVDRTLSVPDLSSFDPDFLRAMLYLQRRDPRITSRVLKYLRCEDLNQHDRRYIGDVVPRTDADDPLRMIRQLGQLAWSGQQSALVFMLDQVEDQSYGEDGNLSFRRAVDTLRLITDEVPSAVGVIACLDDLYETVKPSLVLSARDRLERDPPLQRLRSARSFDEIEAIVARRLAQLYEQTGARFRSDDPLHPIPVEALKRLDNRRLRDVLDFCHRFHEACTASQRILSTNEVDNGDEPIGPVGPGVAGEWDELDLAWNDERSQPHEVPEDDRSLVELIATALGFVRSELGPATVVDHGLAGEHLAVTIDGAKMLVGVANKQPQGGAFGRQVEAIRQAAANDGRTPIVARTSEFPAGPKSTKIVSELRRSGGRREVVWTSDLRAIVAMQALHHRYGAETLAPWLRFRRPITSLSSIDSLLALGTRRDLGPGVHGGQTGIGDGGGTDYADGEYGTRTKTDRSSSSGHRGGTMSKVGPLDEGDGDGDGSVGSDSTVSGAKLPLDRSVPLDLGQIDGSLRFEPCRIKADLLCRHAAVLGATGSGKTTAVLTLIEQLLERDIPAVLVDRKGDLAGYASRAWSDEPGRTEEATVRKQALRGHVDVRLFTPGSTGGRPLALPAVPDLRGVPDHERSTLVYHATTALAGLAGIPERSTLRPILLVAMRLLARAGGPGDLSRLVTLITERDDALVAEVQHFAEKDFTKLVQYLESVRITNDDLFDPSSEVLSASVLLTRDRSGRVPLSIVSTQFLGADARIQLWVARLIGELSRHAARSPSNELQAVVMFDEADVYLPAGAAKPVTKEPMFDLLKRARSGGLGVILATQSPGDFDYKTRDVINTWLVGKVGDKLSINKMRPLFEAQGAGIGSKLGQLSPGQFYLMGSGGTQAVKVNRSLLDTEQLPTHEILNLAAAQRPDGHE